MVVPTSKLLWPFPTPFLSVALMGFGSLLLKVVKEFAASDRTK
jgi:hypothetical protein